MTPEQLIERRKRFQYTQSEMADILGLTLRGYQKLEAQDEPIRASYEMALHFLAIRRAVELEDPSVASKLGRRLAKELAELDTE